MFRTSSRSYAERRLERNADRNSGPARISAIVEVIPIVGVIHVHVVGLVPVIAPIFRIRVNRGKPIAAILETGVPAEFYERKAVNTEIMIPAVVAGEIDIRNAEAIVATTLLPTAVLGIKVASPASMPSSLLFALL